MMCFSALTQLEESTAAADLLKEHPDDISRQDRWDGDGVDLAEMIIQHAINGVDEDEEKRRLKLFGVYLDEDGDARYFPTLHLNRHGIRRGAEYFRFRDIVKLSERQLLSLGELLGVTIILYQDKIEIEADDGAPFIHFRSSRKTSVYCTRSLPLRKCGRNVWERESK